MKYNEEFTQQIFRWVEQNGVYPQRMGASIADLCRQFGIDMETFRDWKLKPEFSEGIKKANEVFKVRTCNDIVNSLVKRAKGYTDIQTEVIGKPDATGGIKSEKVRRVERNVPPDVGAQIFLLTNLDSEQWVNPMKIEAKADITSGGAALKIIVQDEETRKAIDDLANEQSIQGKPHSV